MLEKIACEILVLCLDEGKWGESEGLENERKLEYTFKILVYSDHFLFSSHYIKRNISICQYKDNNDLTILYKNKNKRKQKTHLLIFFFFIPLKMWCPLKLSFLSPSQTLFFSSLEMHVRDKNALVGRLLISYWHGKTKALRNMKQNPQ